MMSELQLYIVENKQKLIKQKLVRNLNKVNYIKELYY